MKPIACLAALAVTATALPASAALPVGTKAPAIETQAVRGGEPFPFSLAKALKKGPVALYFFPKAFTSGCTVETHEFAEAAAEFKKNGATLIGMSADSVGELKKFSIEACRKKFPLGVASPATIAAYDVHFKPGAAITDRTSYVIAPDGKIIFTLSQMNPAGHVEGTLGAVKAWRATHKGRR